MLATTLDISSLNQAAEGLRAHPWVIHTFIALMLCFGLLLTFIGRRLVRPGFIILGFACGALLGHLSPPALHPAGQPLLAAGLLGVLGAIFGWLSFRVFVANALAMVLALAATLGVAAYHKVPAPTVALERATVPNEVARELADRADQNNDLRRQVEGALERARQSLESGGSTAPTTPTDVAAPAEAAERSADLLEVLAERLGLQISDFWNHDLTPAARFALSIASIGGYLAGLVLGFILPSRASAVITAIVGPAVWIPAGVYLLHVFTPTYADNLPTRPTIWLAAWAAAAIVGLAVQLLAGGKKKQPESAAS